MRLPLLLLFLAGGSLAGLAADISPTGSSPSFTWIDPADPAAAAFRQTGEQLINRIGNLLIFEVERSIAEKGLVKSLDVVHLKNLALPKPEPGQPRVTAIKRTSLALRNPANQPDASDRAALEKFDLALREGEEIPRVLIQRLETANAPAEWRVYRPITTMPQCLKCHGPLESLLPEIRELLTRQYPEDKATGYTAYQWRGVIRVSLTAAEPVAAAKTR